MQSAFVGLGFSGLATVYSDFNAALDAASRLVDGAYLVALKTYDNC